MKKRVVKVRVTGWPRTGAFSFYSAFILLKKADSVRGRVRGVHAATPSQVGEAPCIQDTGVAGTPGFPGHRFIPHGALSFAILSSSFNSMNLFSFGTVFKERRKKITIVPTVKHLQCGRPSFNPWVGTIPWRRKWQPTPVLLSGKSHRRRSLVGYSPWGYKESGTTE